MLWRAVAAAPWATLLAISACAQVGPRRPLRISVLGLESLSSHGLEWRLTLKLRIENPNGLGLEFDGISLDLLVDGKPLAHALSDARGELPRYGETILSLPITVSALAVAQLAIKLKKESAAGAAPPPLPYVIKGEVGTTWLGTMHFEHSGLLPSPH